MSQHIYKVTCEKDWAKLELFLREDETEETTSSVCDNMPRELPMRDKVCNEQTTSERPIRLSLDGELYDGSDKRKDHATVAKKRKIISRSGDTENEKAASRKREEQPSMHEAAWNEPSTSKRPIRLSLDFDLYDGSDQIKDNMDHAPVSKKRQIIYSSDSDKENDKSASTKRKDPSSTHEIDCNETTTSKIPIVLNYESDDSNDETEITTSEPLNNINQGCGVEPSGDASLSNSSRRWKKSNPEQWKVNVAARKKNNCEEYVTKNTLRSAKLPKDVDCSSCIFKCQEKFTPEDRLELCKYYWSLDYKRKHDFILTFVKSHEPIRRNKNANPIRNSSRTYSFLKIFEAERVCRKFFQDTLCISNGPVMTAFKGQSEMGVFAKEDCRGKSSPANKKKTEEMNIVRPHINSFPKMEAHYVRKRSQRQYLDKNLNITKMYKLYTQYCEGKCVAPVKLTTYRKFFCNNFNLSFFHPKKDQCPTCTTYEACTDPAKKLQLEEDYQQHQERKVDCNTAKAIDKDRSKSDNTFITVTFDLQSVLQIPKSEVSQFYYSRKICVYNLTVYEGASGQGFCYCWNEMNGKRGSSEIGTALMKWFERLPEEVKEVSLFSDTCGGQNRNKNIAALFLFIVTNFRNINAIEHKFLESGHSFMECDSMHSTIERECKNRSVYGMSGWMEIFKNARGRTTNREPYHVEEMNFKEILDLQWLADKLIKNRLKDENNHTIKWLKIKSMRYGKNLPGIIQYRYDHHSPYNDLRVCGRVNFSVPPVIEKAYKKVIPISIEKKNDLWRLCTSNNIPEEFHGWYAQLPTSKKVSINDLLPETNDSDEEYNE